MSSEEAQAVLVGLLVGAGIIALAFIIVVGIAGRSRRPRG